MEKKYEVMSKRTVVKKQHNPMLNRAFGPLKTQNDGDT